MTEQLVCADSGLMPLLDIATALQDKCADLMIEDVSERNLSFNPIKGFLQCVGEYESKEGALSQLAQQQLCTKIGVPVRYFQKCINSGMIDLAADNINSWIDKYHKNLFIRFFGNNVRGILSDRFSVLDTPQILSVLMSCLGNEWEAKEFLLNEERFHLRLVSREKLNLSDETEVIYPGIMIDSSDVGRSTLRVRFFLYRQVCTNGLCVENTRGTLFIQRHVGITQDIFTRGFVESLDRVNDLCAVSVDMINNALNDKTDFNIKKFNADKAEAFVDRISKATKLMGDEVQNVFDVMYSYYTPTMWGFINALTQSAQEFTLEKRLEYEAAAGKCLSSPKLIQML